MAFHSICRDRQIETIGRSTRKGWCDYGAPELHLQEEFDKDDCNVRVATCVPFGAGDQGRRRDLEESATRVAMTTACWAERGSNGLGCALLAHKPRRSSAANVSAHGILNLF